MLAESFELPMIVVASVRTGESDSVWRSYGKIELGGQFEMNELIIYSISDEEIQFADRGVHVFLNLKVLFKQVILWRSL